MSGRRTAPVTSPGEYRRVPRGFTRAVVCDQRGTSERVEVGARTGYSPSTIASYEQGRRVPPPRFIDVVDELLDAGGVLREMKEEVARAQFPAFFRDVARLEAEAVELHAYDTHVIKGLLQTEEYVRAVFARRRPLLDEGTIEQRVAARLQRQEIFSRWPVPLRSFVIEECALRRPVGGAGVHRGQLERVLAVARHRNVEVRVMPLLREEHAGLGGPFTLIETREGQRIAYVEVQRSSSLHTERSSVRGLEAQYGIIRAQALTPRESMRFVEGCWKSYEDDSGTGLVQEHLQQWRGWPVRRGRPRRSRRSCPGLQGHGPVRAVRRPGRLGGVRRVRRGPDTLSRRRTTAVPCRSEGSRRAHVGEGRSCRGVCVARPGRLVARIGLPCRPRPLPGRELG